MPRSYNPKKVVPLQGAGDSRPSLQIPLSAKLYSIENASKLLNEQFDGGFGSTQIRRFIQSEQWQEGWHYVRSGRRCKIYLLAVQEWQLRR